MASTVGPASAELIDASNLAGFLLVKCEDQTWMVSPYLATSRIEWFQKTLPQGPMDTNADEIIIVGLSAKAVDYSIIWMQQGCFVGGDFADTALQFEAYVRVYKAANFFRSVPLFNAAKHGLSKALEALVMYAARHYGPGQHDEDNRAAIQLIYDGFFRGVRLACGLKLIPALIQFASSVTSHKWLIFSNKHFRSVAKQEVPDFYFNLAHQFANRATHPSWSGDIGVFKCKHCCHPLLGQVDGPECGEARALYLTGKATFLCQKCFVERPEGPGGEITRVPIGDMIMDHV
ncbi:hypothetical protein F4820DRAFT_447278 [Hypoxylon rubiginosum]|uniref:Uncharacterized protein n=1 Tax=Hypoxylon rubiginosum TaxID=110542 RepID=A0ACB9Z2Z7_9PEZI|nr:hypothetical protein F4820DRAFT_447278 [Hypoxylon rubiginosum]